LNRSERKIVFSIELAGLYGLLLASAWLDLVAKQAAEQVKSSPQQQDRSPKQQERSPK